MSPPEVLDECARVMPPLDAKDCCPWEPGTVWNGMLNPLTPMSFAGMVYYQGESDIYHNSFYNCAFPAFVRSWRERSQIDLPVVMAMTHPFFYVTEDVVYLPQMRLNQASFLDIIQQFSLAVTIDLGDQEFPSESLHPHNKTLIAQRLASSMVSLRSGRAITLNSSSTSKTAAVCDMDMVT